MFKKILFIVVSIMLCLSMSIGTSALGVTKAPSSQTLAVADSEIQPCYNYTALHQTNLLNSSGKAKCAGYLCGYDGITTKIKITLTLQKKTLLWWSEVDSSSITVNDYIADLTTIWSVDSGKYRVKAVYVVYSGSDSETITGYSSTVEF